MTSDEMPNTPREATDFVAVGGAKKVEKTVTLADVAREAGVATSTVSFTLSGKRTAAPETREAIFSAARRLGYVPNPYAQRLATGRSLDLVALFTLTIDYGVNTQNLLGIQRSLHEDGLRAPIYGYDYHTAFEPQEQAALMRDLRLQKPLAIVCATAGMQAEALNELQRYLEEGGNAVCFSYSGSAPVECDQVIMDGESESYHAAKHLLELGHRRIAFFKTGPWGEDRPRIARIEGLKRALAEFGIPWDEEWSLWGGEVNAWERSGQELALRWAGMPKATRPTGFTIVNDFAAQAFLVQVLRLGFQVPYDVSVVGNDDQPIAEFGRVPLTTTRFPKNEIVQTALRFIRDRLHGFTGPPRQQWIQGQLIVRESTAPPPPQS
jgi:DNA-binding LacI/PurR family transcriptional regulator